MYKITFVQGNLMFSLQKSSSTDKYKFVEMFCVCPWPRRLVYHHTSAYLGTSAFSKHKSALTPSSILIKLLSMCICICVCVCIRQS